jgi:hypothetical protein
MLVWLQFIVMKYLVDPRLEQSRFSCYIAWAFPHYSFHSCNYVIFISWCTYTYSPWETWIHACRKHLCLSHRDTAPAVETRHKPDKVDQDNGACVPCSSTSRRLQVLRIKCISQYSSRSFDHGWSLLCTALNNALCIIVTTLLRSMLPHLTVTCILKTTGLVTYVVLHFRQFVLARNHIMRSLCANFVSPCTILSIFCQLLIRILNLNNFTKWWPTM